jgi:hypothetical protein
MKKIFGFLLLFLGMLFVGETAIARTHMMDSNMHVTQGAPLSADEMQEIRGGEALPVQFCANWYNYCVMGTSSWWIEFFCTVGAIFCMLS